MITKIVTVLSLIKGPAQKNTTDVTFPLMMFV